MGQEIWVVAEQNHADITDLTKELLGVAKTAAQRDGIKVCAVLVGYKTEGLEKSLASYGAERVYIADHKELEHYNAKACVDTISELAKKHRPLFIICGMTFNGKDLSARLAARLKTHLFSACAALKPTDNNRFEVTGLVYNGLAMSSRIVGIDETAILGFLPKIRGLESPDDARDAELIKIETILPGDRYPRHIETVAADFREIDLTESDFVMSCGHGMCNKNSFHLIWQLAEILGATVGGSRPTVDKGWLPAERMIGMTGKTVSPELYLAFGISGAVQHIMGIKDSKYIVAINKDAQAPIMQIADLAVMGDVLEVLPALIEKIKAFALSRTRLIESEASEAI
jgi:electron transfer flavoprotein alpha subunit